MKIQASTVAEYLAALPPEQRRELSVVRALIKKHLPKGYVEALAYGMIGYVVPLARFPDGYLGQKDVPLPYVSLGAQKHHLAVYLTHVYSDAKLERRFRGAYARSGKKLDMGKSCVRFKKAADLALEAIADAVAHTSVAEHVERYVATRGKKTRTSAKKLR